MANEGRILVYFDELVVTLAKQYSATMDTHIYSPRDILSSIQGLSPIDAEEVVRCKGCKHWHEEIGWCNQHSHFVGEDGEACHPWESSEWKMLNEDDFCSYGERRTDV